MSSARTAAPAPVARDPLAPLQDATLRSIAATGVVRTFPRNTILMNEGEHGETLYIIISGRVKVFASNAAGKEIVIALFGPGEYVGEMALDGNPRSASVITTEPTTCAVVHRAQLREFIISNPDFALHLIEKLIRRVRATTEDMKSLALSDVYGRLVRLINSLAREVNGRTIIPERLTQQDIAERVGASRDMISRLMKDLVAGGYLALEDHIIVVRKRPPPGW